MTRSQHLPDTPRRVRRGDGAAAPRGLLHIVEAMGLGGMERMIAALVNATDREKFDVQILCMKSIGEVGESLSRHGIPVHYAGIVQGSGDLFPFKSLARQIRALRPSVVHTHNSPALFFGAPSAWLAGVRQIVHTEHGRVFPDRTVYMVAERLASTVVRHVVGVSDAITEALHTFEHIPKRKLSTIPNGVPSAADVSDAELAGTLQSLGLTPNTPLVGTTGRLVWEKGLPHLIEGWKTVRVAVPDAVLMVVGDGPLRAELESLAAAQELADSIRFVGKRDDVNTLLRLMRVFVMSSVSEGLPLALLEAMSAATPIVATDVGGIPNALGDGTCGLIVPPANPGALAAGIIALLRDTAQARVFGAKAEERFEKLFTASAMAKAYETLYAAPAR